MNSDSTPAPASGRDEPDDPEEKPKSAKKLDLSLTQVIGGSLAAATAAALGSKLGVAGTIIGAAVVSVISAVAASIYTTSLRQTRKAAKAAVEIVRVRRIDPQRSTDIALDALPPGIASKVRRRRVDTQVLSAETSGRSQQDTVVTGHSDDTVVLGEDGAGGEPDPAVDDAAKGTDAAEEVEVSTAVVAVEGKVRRLRLRPMLIGAGAIFLVAIVGITGYELASGESISGGNRTTLQQVVEGRTTQPSGPAEPSDTQDQQQQPSTSTTPPSDGASESATPTTGETTSGSSESTPSTTSSTTEETTPTQTQQSAAPTENAKPEAGQSPPASPTGSVSTDGDQQ